MQQPLPLTMQMTPCPLCRVCGAFAVEEGAAGSQRRRLEIRSGDHFSTLSRRKRAHPSHPSKQYLWFLLPISFRLCSRKSIRSPHYKVESNIYILPSLYRFLKLMHQIIAARHACLDVESKFLTNVHSP